MHTTCKLDFAGACTHRPSQESSYTISATLPSVADSLATFAVRGVFRRGNKGDYVNTPCAAGPYDEADDLLFYAMPNLFG